MRIGAAACPECGSDEKTGWSEEAEEWTPDLEGGYDGDDSFDYDGYVRREFGEGAAPPQGIDLKRVCYVLLVILVLVSLLAYFF